MDKEQKDKILEYLCKKCNIDRFAYDRFGHLQFYYVRNNKMIKQYVCRCNDFSVFVLHKQNKKQHILDLLLHWSNKGFHLSNSLEDLGNAYIVNILMPFTSIYELQIEMDLEKQIQKNKLLYENRRHMHIRKIC